MEELKIDLLVVRELAWEIQKIINRFATENGCHPTIVTGALSYILATTIHDHAKPECVDIALGQAVDFIRKAIKEFQKEEKKDGVP